MKPAVILCSWPGNPLRKVDHLLLVLSLMPQCTLWAQDHGRGMVYDDFEFHESPVKISYSERSNLPQKHSLKPYCPQPGNQLQMAASVGWATTYAARTILDARHADRKDPRDNARNSYSPNFIAKLSLVEDDCDAGGLLPVALEKLKTYGAPTFLSMMDMCIDTVPREVYQEADDSQRIDYARLFHMKDAGIDKIAAIKRALVNNYPVVAGLIAPPSLEKADLFWQPLENPSDDFPGQALTIIGYDETLFGGAFEVINSWGRDWGNEGFTWIRYPDMMDFMRYAYEVYLPDSPDFKNEASRSVRIHFVSGGDTLKAKLMKNGTYRLTKPIRSGQEFTIAAEITNRGYYYCLYESTSGDRSVLHPENKYYSPVLPYRHNRAVIPPENKTFRLDRNTGRERFALIFSRSPLEEKGIFRTGRELSFEEYVMLLTDSRNKMVEWNPKQIGFRALPSPDVIAVLVEFEHKD